MSLTFSSLVRRSAAIGAALVIGAAVRAADESRVIFPGNGSPADTVPVATASGSLHSMSLFLGLALAGAGGWMVWRNRQGKPVGREMRALLIDETRTLGNRQYLVVASYEGKKFLLGVCPGRIDLLSPLDSAAGLSREKTRE